MIAANGVNYFDDADWGLFAQRWGSESGEGIKLNSDPSYNVFIYPVYKVLAFDGWNSEQTHIQKSAWLNEDGSWKTQSSDSPMGYMQLVELDEDIEPFKKGDIIPVGQYDTLKVIKHRNKILTDSAFNLPVPQKTEYVSEYENVKYLYDKVIADNENQSKYGGLYHKNASLCYAYEPIIDKKYTLSEKFKSHRWYSVSSGELMRIGYYAKRSYYDENSGDFSIFWQPILDKLIAADYANIFRDKDFPDRMGFVNAGSGTFGRQRNGNWNVWVYLTANKTSTDLAEAGEKTFQYMYTNPDGQKKRIFPVCRF